MKCAILLIIVFCLVVFVIAEGVSAVETSPCSAHPKGMHILSDGRTCADGKLVFSIILEYICGGPLTTDCNANLAKNPEFKYDFTDHSNDASKYQSAGKFWGVSSTNTGTLSTNEPYLGFIRDITWTVQNGNYPGEASMIDEPGCWGEANPDYPWGVIENEMQNNWNYVRSNYPNQILLMNNWRCFDTYIPFVHMFTWDPYINSASRMAEYGGRDNVVYAEELALTGFMRTGGSKPWSA